MADEVFAEMYGEVYTRMSFDVARGMYDQIGPQRYIRPPPTAATALINRSAGLPISNLYPRSG